MRTTGPVIVMELPEQLNHAQAKLFSNSCVLCWMQSVRAWCWIAQTFVRSTVQELQ